VIYEIRKKTSIGRLLGTVESTSFVGAANLAASKFFKLPHAARDTGWAGKAGTFLAYEGEHVPPITAEKLFYVSEREKSR
jgi:hypothetical protein